MLILKIANVVLLREKKRKKSIVLWFCLIFSINAFAGKLVNNVSSPLSILESESIKKTWCESEGYAFIETFGNLHYWCYDSYLYHDGDITELVSEIVPNWLKSLGYYPDSEYKIFSPNENLAPSVKQLMIDLDCDVSITFVRNTGSSADYVCINSYDVESRIYTTYILYVTKNQIKKTINAEDTIYNEFLIDEIVKALNKSGSNKGDRFYTNLLQVKNSRKKIASRTVDQFDNPLPPTAYEYIVNRIYERKKKGTPFNRHTILTIQYECMSCYEVSEKFKIAYPISIYELVKVINALQLSAY